jgi:hypothetical protein
MAHLPMKWRAVLVDTSASHRAEAADQWKSNFLHGESGREQSGLVDQTLQRVLTLGRFQACDSYGGVVGRSGLEYTQATR